MGVGGRAEPRGAQGSVSVEFCDSTFFFFFFQQEHITTVMRKRKKRLGLLW